MEYLHAKRIVHFDLKTGNLLVWVRDSVPCCKVRGTHRGEFSSGPLVSKQW